MDNSVALAVFRDNLRDNRKIILTHKGKRYKARDISAVLFSRKEFKLDGQRRSRCPYCGEGHHDAHVVTAGYIIFLIYVWSGCLTYDPEVEVNSFEAMNGLKAFLENEKETIVYEKLFSEFTAGDKEESSTDSY